MPAFFRRIRRSLVVNAKFRNYLIYAIGEIFLVVIGILIALEINNWNQDQIERRKEKLLLKEIHAEFQFNKWELEDNRRAYERVLGKCEKIICLFPIHVQQGVDLDTLGRYLHGIDFNGSFDMSQGSVQSLKNTSSLDIISNEELRTLLIRIEDLVADYSAREIRSIDFVEQVFMSYLETRVPYPFEEGIHDKRIDLTFLGSIAFENLIKERAEKIRVFLGMIQHEEEQLVRSINRIIELSAPEN